MSVLVCDASQRHRFTLLLATEEGEIMWQAPAVADGKIGSSGGALSALLGQDLSGCTACIATDGPGSYTGLRAALSVAGGIAHVMQLPIYVIGTLIPPVLYCSASGATVWSMCDAGRSGCYLGAYTWDKTDVECTTQPFRTSFEDGVQHTSGQYVSYRDDPMCSAGALNGGCDPALALARSVPFALARKPVELAEVVLSYAVPSISEHVR